MPASELQPLFDLLKTAELPDLGPGPRGDVDSKPALDAKLQTIFKTTKISSNRSELIRALILLWHDHHDDAHTIVQDIENGDGAFIHGMLHRREPDYWNSKYWFRRVGKHPAFADISERSAQLLQATGSPVAAQLVPAGKWDPMAFVDACESASQKPGGDAQTTLLRDLQKIETECLLEHLCS